MSDTTNTTGFYPWTITAALFYGAIGFQVFHLVEHLLQVAYWALHPLEPPWLTPWAVVGRDALAAGIDGRAGTGNELLHLAGNVVFLVGILAGIAVVGGRGGSMLDGTWLRRAMWVQGFHVAEHVALTITWLTVGAAHGLSTAFGVLAPGTTVASGVRVWLHFAVNLVATAVAWRAAHEVRAARRGAGPDGSAPVGRSPDRSLPAGSASRSRRRAA